MRTSHLASALVTTMAAFPGLAEGQTTYHVPDHFPTIQGALNGAASGDTIIVRAGTYVENIDFVGKEVVLKSEDGPAVTIIDGSQGAGVRGSVVKFQSGEGLGAVLHGFTVTNGVSWLGAGVYVEGAGATISGNIITGNTGVSGPVVAGTGGPEVLGGGIYGSGGPIHVLDNVIKQNGGLPGAAPTEGYGAGIYLYACDGCVIDGNQIEDNVLNGGWDCCFPDGGGMYACCCDNLIVTRNTFRRNTSVDGGAAVVINNGGVSLDMRDNMVIDNQNGDFSSVVLDADPLSISGLTIAGNTGGTGLVRIRNSPNVTIHSSVVWGNSPSVIRIWRSSITLGHSVVEGGRGSISGGTVSWGPGMLSVDPRFMDPTQSDYHLQHTSPCKNAGDPAATGTTDFEGDPRIAGGRIDMGADEYYPHLYYTGDATPGGNMELKIIGEPGDLALLWFGAGVLPAPWQTPFGEWHLRLPLLGNVFLGPVGVGGVAKRPVLIPSRVSPLALPMQGAAQLTLTNLSVLGIE